MISVHESLLTLQILPRGLYSQKKILCKILVLIKTNNVLIV
jgi:hypothetical protein